MEAMNTFEDGMDNDLSKHLPANNKYLKALNLRPVGTLGGANGSLSNVLGNNCEITFPRLRNVYKLQIVKSYDPDTNYFIEGTINITINGQTTPDILITENMKPSDIAAYINSLSNCYNGIYNINYTFTTAFNNDYVYIYQNPEYKLCSTIQSQEPVILITTVSDGSTVKYINSNNEATSIVTPYINSIQTNDPLVIIGSTYINNNIYLITTTQNNTQKLGQVWELVYDEINKSSTVKLLYNNYINLSKEFPIAPTACLGRYELPSIQRIYWSDFNNPVRSLNVKDKNTLATEPTLLNLKASVKMSMPTLYNILDSGATNNLIASTAYYLSYRLVKNNSEITNYSVMSNPVFVTTQKTTDFISGQDNYCSLSGSTGSVNKSIVWEINGVDTSYDSIELIIVIQDHNTPGFYKIYKYDTLSINGQETIQTTFKNNIADFIEISESEFTIENSSFTYCKTLENKDNRLFYGNVKNSLGEYLANYDTRAYRFGDSTNNQGDLIKFKKYESDNVLTSQIITLDSDYNNIDSLADNIPTINLGMDSTLDTSLYNDTFKYKRNSTTIGGEGPNVKFKFGTTLLRTDYTPTNPTAASLTDSLMGTDRDVSASTQLYKNGYRKAGGNSSVFTPSINDRATNQKYYASGSDISFNTMALEYFNGNYKGYQQNEIYRFAVVFKSKTHISDFAKHIADIKFPNYNDLVEAGMGGKTSIGNECPDFRSMYYDASGAYSVIPYIEFEVNIPEELNNLISGYEIVRVDRKASDRSIGEHGLINQVMYWNGSDGYLPISHYLPTNGTDSMNPDTGTTVGKANGNLVSFHPFSYVSDGDSSLITKGDRLIITEKYRRVINNPVWPFSTAGPGGSFEPYYYVNKYYDFVESIYNNPSYPANNLVIDLATYLGLAENKTMGTYALHNYDRNLANESYAMGTGTIITSLDSSTPITWSAYNGGGSDLVSATGSTACNSKLLAVHFKPNVLTTQYGGRTALARGNNQYISIGAYNPVESSGITKIKVYGGDIFHGILDIQKAIKNNAGVFSRPMPTTNNVHSQTWFFPTHSVYNIDLRNGYHVNADLNTVNNYADITDEYIYHKGYSMLNTLTKYYAKPLTFNETNIFNNRIYWSEVKINGELSDSWANIPADNYYDIDGNYGEINSLITLKNNMYAIQETALAALQINPVSVITDSNNQPLKLGSGTDILSKHFYHSVDIGTKHQWSVSKSPNEITFCDIRHKKIYLFNGQEINPISDTKGNRGILNKLLHDNILVSDNPIINKGILTTYDYLNNEFLYTFLNSVFIGENNNTENYTLCYSDLIGKFSSFYSFTPYIYVNNHSKLFSVNSYSSGILSKIYLHNKGNYNTFYDTTYPSALKVMINENPLKTKVFDNLSWNTESIKDNLLSIDDLLDNVGESDNINYLTDTFSSIRVYNEYQNTDYVNLNTTPRTGNLRRVEQSWNLQIPRNKVNYDSTNVNTKSIFDPTVLTKTLFKERIRDKYIIIDLVYPNSLNNRFIINNLKTTYRTSDR